MPIKRAHHMLVVIHTDNNWIAMNQSASMSSQKVCSFWENISYFRRLDFQFPNIKVCQCSYPLLKARSHFLVIKETIGCDKSLLYQCFDKRTHFQFTRSCDNKKGFSEAFRILQSALLSPLDTHLNLKCCVLVNSRG